MMKMLTPGTAQAALTIGGTVQTANGAPATGRTTPTAGGAALLTTIGTLLTDGRALLTDMGTLLTGGTVLTVGRTLLTGIGTVLTVGRTALLTAVRTVLPLGGTMTRELTAEGVLPAADLPAAAAIRAAGAQAHPAANGAGWTASARGRARPPPRSPRRPGRVRSARPASAPC